MNSVKCLFNLDETSDAGKKNYLIQPIHWNSLEQLKLYVNYDISQDYTFYLRRLFPRIPLFSV